MKYYFYCLALIVVLTSCSKKSSDEATPTPTPTPAAQRNVEYRIGCTDCEVIYTNGHGDTTVTEFHKTSSWSYSFTGKAGDPVTLFAYNTSTTIQGVSACIMLNGDTLKQLTTYCPVSGYSFVTDTLH